MSEQSINDYFAETEALLERLTERLRNNLRVRAAWLFGSFGRGNPDALSDLDLWVVVADDAIEAIRNSPEAFARIGGEPVVILDAPQNAPVDGAYLMAIYDGVIAPHQVDWYWQPESQANRFVETRLLFDHIGLPESEQATPGGAGKEATRTEAQQAAATIQFFWAMLMICAKYARRSPHEQTMSLAKYPLNSLREVSQFIGEKAITAEELPDHPTPALKRAALLSLADAMEAAMPLAAARGAVVPERAAEAARRYIRFVLDT